MNISKQLHEETILNILNDSIIFEKMSNGINKVLQAYTSNVEHFKVEDNHNGHWIAAGLLGVTNSFEQEILLDQLSTTYYSMIYKVVDTDDIKNAQELAKDIYIEWLQLINAYKDSERLKEVIS